RPLPDALPISPARDTHDDDVPRPGSRLESRRDEYVSRQLLVVRYDEPEVAGRVVYADDGFPRPLEHLDDPTFGPLPSAPLLHPGDDAVPMHRRPHAVPGDEQVPGAVLGHHEAGAAADRVEPADDEVDLLGGG